MAVVNKKSSEMFIICNEVVTSDKFPASVTLKIEAEDNNDVTEMDVDEVQIKTEQLDDDKNSDDVIDDDEVKVSHSQYSCHKNYLVW